MGLCRVPRYHILGVVDGGLVDGLGVVHGFVDDGLVDRLGVVALAVDGGVDGGVGGLALVLHVHDVARVGIGSVVGDNLGTAIGEEDTVLAIGGVAIPGLVGAKVNLSVVGVLSVDAILVLIVGRAVLGLFVGGGVVGGLMDGGAKGDGEEGGKGDEDLHC